jgi:hypothetical protein
MDSIRHVTQQRFPSSRVIVILVEQNPIQTTLVMPYTPPLSCNCYA